VAVNAYKNAALIYLVFAMECHNLGPNRPLSLNHNRGIVWGSFFDWVKERVRKPSW